MMHVYTLIDLDNIHEPISFLSKDDADSYMLAFDHNWKLYISKHVTHLNAASYINWKDIPQYLNFVYRDHSGVWASMYRPKSKWFLKTDQQTFRMYGGERVKLEYKKYHELIKLGDIFENQNNTSHFINWNKVKGSYAIKFIDNLDQTIEIFSDQGELLVSGSNDDFKVINKKGSFQFEKFPWQTYTFMK